MTDLFSHSRHPSPEDAADTDPSYSGDTDADGLGFFHDTHLHPDEDDACMSSYGETMGNPVYDAQFWQEQTTPFTCAVQAQRGIIEEFTGQPVSEAQLVYDATSHGWLNDGGMSPNDVGKILDLYGVPSHHRTGGTVEELMDELSHGHKVIVGVDSEEIWKHGQPLDGFFHHAADHAVWVTGINNDDPGNPKVIINDSGDPHGGGKEYELSRFESAWEDSGFFYVATDNAPPGMAAQASGFDPGSGVFPDLVAYFDGHRAESHAGGGLAAHAGDDAGAQAQDVIGHVPSGQKIAKDIIDHVTDMVEHRDPAIVQEGNSIAQGILDHIDQVLAGQAGQGAAHSDHALQFGAGKCSHCGGSGYTTWPSSGTSEKCWYCDGSGVAH